jgi:hypothetical protein
MATLKLDETIRTRDAVVDIAGDLPIGNYLVRLVVETANGRSEPAELVLRVVRGLDIRPDPFNPVPFNPLRPT